MYAARKATFRALNPLYDGPCDRTASRYTITGATVSEKAFDRTFLQSRSDGMPHETRSCELRPTTLKWCKVPIGVLIYQIEPKFQVAHLFNSISSSIRKEWDNPPKTPTALQGECQTGRRMPHW